MTNEPLIFAIDPTEADADLIAIGIKAQGGTFLKHVPLPAPSKTLEGMAQEAQTSEFTQVI